jgi:hypothetical protein
MAVILPAVRAPVLRTYGIWSVWLSKLLTASMRLVTLKAGDTSFARRRRRRGRGI